MLDVLLVLLIVFLAASIRMHHTLDASLPQPCGAACAGGDAIVLEVLPGNQYRINHAQIPPEELQERLTAIYRDRPEKIIQIAGHPGVAYSTVYQAMDIARSAGVRVVGIAPRAAYLR